jgi:hypothetical protein
MVSYWKQDTRTENIYKKMDYPPALAQNSTYDIPSLQGFFPITDKACAMCIMNLLSPESMAPTNLSVPFPVVQQSAYPHKRFSTENPTGIEDASISAETTAALREPVANGDGLKLNVGMIVGVVVGVLGGTAMLALLYWWLWKKRKGRAKVVDSAASSTAGQGTGGANRTTHSIALQRIQGVVRRPDTSASEVPPPYHEAVRSGNAPPISPPA